MIKMYTVHLSSLDLNLLPILRAVLESGSVRQGAEQVALSPSATSHALRRARELFGDALLVRAGRELVPTAHGERVREKLGPLLDELEALLTDVSPFDPARLERDFRIACSDYAELTLIQPMGLRLARIAPSAGLYCQNPVGHFEDGLRAGTLDIAIGVFRAPPPDFRKKTLVTDGFVCAMRPGHPAAKKKLTLDHYLQLEHILVAPRGTAEGVVDRALRPMGRKRRIARLLSNFLVAPMLVAESDYVVTMSRRVLDAISDQVELVTHPPPLKLDSYQVSAMWHQRSDRDPAIQWLIDELAGDAK